MTIHFGITPPVKFGAIANLKVYDPDGNLLNGKEGRETMAGFQNRMKVSYVTIAALLKDALQSKENYEDPDFQKLEIQTLKDAYKVEILGDATPIVITASHFDHWVSSKDNLYKPDMLKKFPKALYGTLHLHLKTDKDGILCASDLKFDANA